MVHGILLARVPTSAAEDLVQDVFLQALNNLHTLRDAARFGPWLASIARNRAADFHRRRKPEDSLDEPGTGNAAGTSPAGAAAVEGMDLLAALRDLPEVYREPLILRFVEGMTGPEIAGRSGLTHGSVRVNLHRGLQLLREKYFAGERQPGKHNSENEKKS
jgi:RNA polymerase sigma-70 factor (ECF subfamily)